MKSRNFVYFQPNKKDLKDTYGDCVVRTFARVMGKEWVEVFDELVLIARELQCMPNSKPAYQEYLKRNGFTYTGISNKKGSKRPTVNGFANQHKEGIYVLVVANHIVACVDGKFYDTWDSGRRCLYGCWTK